MEAISIVALVLGVVAVILLIAVLALVIIKRNDIVPGWHTATV